jgi:hypothetical protein
VYIPGGECVRTIIKVNDDLSISAPEFDNARVFLTENALEIHGPVFSRIFHMTTIHGKLERFDQLYIPVLHK